MRAPGVRRVPRRSGDDAGHTIVEVTVSMVIFVFVLTAFGATVKVMTGATSRVVATVDSIEQTRLATDSLSRMIPYAAQVNTPTRVGNDWYLEVLTTSVKAASDPTCTQWRVSSSTGLLQVRSWSTLTPVASAWATLARGVVNDPATQPPFTALAQDTAFSTVRVGLFLWVRRPSSGAVTTNAVYALRSPAQSGATGTDVVCRQVGRP